MLHKQKFVQAGKLLVCSVLLVSLSGCYLSLGGGGRKKKDDGDNIVVTTGGQAAPPVIINNTQPTTVAHPIEQPLKPTNQ